MASNMSPAAISVIPGWNLSLEQARLIISHREDLVRALAKRTAFGPNVQSIPTHGLLAKSLDLLPLTSLLSMLGTIETEFPISCMLYHLSHTEHITCPNQLLRVVENSIHFPPGKLLRADI